MSFGPGCLFPAALSLESDSMPAEGHVESSDSGILRFLPQLQLIPYPFEFIPPALFTSHRTGLDLSWSASYSVFAWCIKEAPWGAWVAQSVKRLTSAQVMILWSVSSSPALGSVLTTRSLEPASDSAHPPTKVSQQTTQRCVLCSLMLLHP